MKAKIIYHQTSPKTDCPDGIASAWVAYKAHPNADIEGCSYAYEKLPEVEGYNLIIIVDFSFSKEVLETWANKAEVIVIDHHKTAMADLSTLSERILKKFDMDECGATLAWKTFFPNQEMPAFLEYVRDRDLWNFELEDSEELHEAIASLRYQSMPGVDKLVHVFEIFNMLEKMSAIELKMVFAPWGYQLLKPKRERIVELAQTVPRLTDNRHYTEAEINSASFVFSKYTVVK